MAAASDQAPARMPFREATGKGLKIAVIDSGINANHPHIVAKTSGIVVAGAHDTGVNEEMSWNDALGHGTAVAAAIQEKAPGAEYYAVKLFDTSLRASSSQLVAAIKWAIDNGMDLINLSLGTQNLAYRPQLELLIEKGRAAGIVMICARHEGRHSVLPGMLDGVLSVDVDWELTRHAYRIDYLEGRNHFFASGFPRPLPGISPVRNLSGISFAVANMTGLVARACEGVKGRSLQSIEQALSAEALRLKT